MAEVKAVFFDLGGTLYDYRQFERLNRESIQRLVAHAGIDAEWDVIAAAYRDGMRKVFREYLPQPYYLHRDLFQDAASAALQRLGVAATEIDFDDFFAHQRELRKENFQLRDGVIETLSRLRDRKLGLGIVSNIDQDQLEEFLTLGGLERRFDWCLSSEVARSCKPDKRIFEQALERAGCNANEVLFVGDSLPQDIAGANQAGLRSVLLWHREDHEPDTARIQPMHRIRNIPEILELVG